MMALLAGVVTLGLATLMSVAVLAHFNGERSR